jgi:Tfp pilus assembly protein PilV
MPMSGRHFAALVSRPGFGPASRRVAAAVKRKPRAGARGFTLIEVTISVALALFLMLGISQVFRVVGETVGTGTALATAQRDGRSAQAVMNADFNSAVSDGAPFMMLYSQQIFAFANANDLAGDKDGNPATADLTGTGTESQLPAAVYNSRSHRIDAFSFFGRGQFNRQTGADANASAGASPFVSNMSCPEAFLWYGHLNLADNNGTFTPAGTAVNNTPGAGTTTIGNASYYSTVNPNNYFASSWILGRQQILLTQASSLDYYNGSPAGTAIYDKSYPGVPQYAYTNILGNALDPLALKSEAYSTGTTVTAALAGANSATLTTASSRLDIANTSIPAYRSIVASYIPSATYPPTNPTWYQLLFTGLNNNRFRAQPFFLTKPATPENVAYQAPIFVRGCTQFTVEYAGDYLNQNPTTGAVINAYATVTGTPGTTSETAVATGNATNPTDGQIDYYFYLPPPVGGVQQAPVKKIRWYGLPRSTTNNSTISAVNGDVVPLRDLWPAANGTQAPFEMVLPTAAAPVAPADYISTMTSTPAAPAQYICAWGPNDPKPRMIRITMTVDDPGGRLGDGQTFEYIYTLP